MPVYQDLTGLRFGTFVVLRRANKRSERIHWRCRCDCGRERLMRSNEINAQPHVCRCQDQHRIKHGQSYSPTYRRWIGMLGRCYCKKHTRYADWGGRGITVCARWRFGEDSKSGFECFLSDMGPLPSAKHTIDRYPDNSGNYEPSNCRWATMKQQAINKRGRKLTAADVLAIRADPRIQVAIAKDFKISQVVVSAIKRGKTWAHVM